MKLLLFIQAWLFCFVPFTVDAKKKLNAHDAVEFLSAYGYVSSAKMQEASGDGKFDISEFRDSIRAFQEFIGLNPTGELDEETKRKMTEPRCGVSDVQNIADGELRWDKNDLTYSIKSYSNDLPRDAIRHAIDQAFSLWSAVTPLNFKEVLEGGDMEVGFGVGRHGDNWPFDGKGEVLAHAYYPKQGKIHFDDAEDWTYMDVNQIYRGYMDLLPVAIHEIGHALGLDHSRKPESIMAPNTMQTVGPNGQYKFPDLTIEDITRIQDIYGRRTMQSPDSSLPDSGTPRKIASRKEVRGRSQLGRVIGNQQFAQSLDPKEQYNAALESWRQLVREYTNRHLNRGA